MAAWPIKLTERSKSGKKHQILFLVSCPKGQVEKYVDVEAWGPASKRVLPNLLFFF
jgi:hypothetical protein